MNDIKTIIINQGLKGDPGTSGSSDSFALELITFTPAMLETQSTELAASPISPEKTKVELLGCGPQAYLEDFILIGNVLSWEDKGMAELPLEVGDQILVQYFIY